MLIVVTIVIISLIGSAVSNAANNTMKIKPKSVLYMDLSYDIPERTNKNDLGLNYIKIDDIYQTENYSLNIYKIYKNAISSIKNNCFNLEQINNDIEECKKYSKNKILSSGFIGGIGDILNYEKK